MKTKNLTTWCNLFSTELKFNITVKPSRYHHYLRFAYLLFWVLISVLLFKSTENYYIEWLIVFVALVNVLYFYKARFQKAAYQNTLDKNLEISGDGEYVCNNTKYCIQPSSCVGIWGVWLRLKKVSDNGLPINKTANKLVFYFSDSFTNQEYSRLCRVIKKVKYQSADENRQSYQSL